MSVEEPLVKGSEPPDMCWGWCLDNVMSEESRRGLKKTDGPEAAEAEGKQGAMTEAEVRVM